MKAANGNGISGGKVNSPLGEDRRTIGGAYSICWQDHNGHAASARAYGLDTSPTGIRLFCTEALPLGASAFVEGPDGLSGYCLVRQCAPGRDGFSIDLEFTSEAQTTVASSPAADIDFYEFLQISPRAEFATIHRVYRFMASRFHPDNPETGDPEKFLLLKHAFEVLSDPARRAEYDLERELREARPDPLFELSEFVNGIEGEMNRRLGVLSVLYNKRRTNPADPKVSLLDLEKRMAFPREYLDFTTWYLRSKKYITVADNSDFELTALGVDYVESNATTNPILARLLKSGVRTATDSGSKPPGFDFSPGQFRLGPPSGPLPNDEDR